MFSRKWDWFFGVEEGGGDQESQHDNQLLQRDSKDGCRESQLNSKVVSRRVVVIKNHRATIKDPA